MNYPLLREEVKTETEECPSDGRSRIIDRSHRVYHYSNPPLLIAVTFSTLAITSFLITLAVRTTDHEIQGRPNYKEFEYRQSPAQWHCKREEQSLPRQYRVHDGNTCRYRPLGDSGMAH